MERTEAMQAAIEIVRAQASARPMTEAEITSMTASLTASIMNLGEGAPAMQPTPGQGVIDPAKARKESSITCLECGKSFKILTRKHLAGHSLTPEEYREKYGYRKGQALACKSLTRERRKRMASMELWKRREKKVVA